MPLFMQSSYIFALYSYKQLHPIYIKLIKKLGLCLVAWHYSHITESLITGFDHCGCLNTEFVYIAERWNHSNIYKCSENQANTYKVHGIIEE